jgi:hypothetical protein
MASSNYYSALELAGSLPPDEQIRLIRSLLSQSSAVKPNAGQSSILDIAGLGIDLWGQFDAQEYVRRERESWTG